MKRREFLRDSLIAAGSALLASRSGLAYSSQTPKKVLIIGGGLSGLVVAYELKKLGHNVTVLEAQDRIGGRVVTIRSFADNLWADAGAARIPKDHDLTHRYVKEFGLELIPFYPTTHKFQRINNGQAEPVDWGPFARATSSTMGIDPASQWQKIKGGNDNLPRAFADRLKNEIHMGSPVVSVEQDERQVRVKFTEKGKTQMLAGDHLVCAIPFTMLRTIDFTPRLSDKRMDVINRETYDSASRIFIQTKDRFWLNQQLNGFAFGKNKEEIWDASFGEEGTHGILETYSRYDVSMGLTRQTQDARIETTLGSLEIFLPELRKHFDKGVSKCWSEDPWVKGAWAHLDMNHGVTLAQPDKRISFCGEHLSFAPSWMQGALQSGLRVVQEITTAARPAADNASNAASLQAAAHQ